MSEIEDLEKHLADLKKQREETARYEQDVKAGEKIKGIVAELLTYDDEGKRVGSKLVFRPFCEYYVPKWNDEYAETEFTPDKFIEDFGEDVFRKVTAGEIVEAESTIGEYSIKKTCSTDRDFIKVKDNIIFPYAGKTERLVRKSIYLKIHPEKTELQEPEKNILYRENEEWWISSRSGVTGPYKSKKEAIDYARASGLKTLIDDEGIDLLKESACPECDIKKKEDETCLACEFAVSIGMYLNVCRDLDSEENCQELFEKVTNDKIAPEEFFNIIREKAKDKPEKLDILAYIDELMEKASGEP